MIGYYVLCFFFLAAKAQDIGFASDDSRSKIIWHDDQPLPTYFVPHTEANVDRVTKRPLLSEDIPLWPSKDSGMNLKFPKFLFTEDDAGHWKENPKPVMPKPKPKEVYDHLEQNLQSPGGVAALQKVLEEEKLNANNERPDPKNMMDIHNSVFVQKRPNAEEDLVKEKIFTLAKDTENDLDNKVKIIEKTNAMFKQNNYYKLGFIVSYINTTHSALTDLMRHVERNKEEWDVLKVLNAYVQIKKTKEFLLEMLSVLNFLQSRQSMPSSGMDKKRGQQGIAWSYYDDQ